MNLYKLAIFDFDGTLVDSAPGIVDVMEQVVGEYELDAHILDQWRNLIGVPLPNQMEVIFPSHGPDFHLEVADRYRAIYDAQAVAICPLFPGLVNMLDRLNDCGIDITIATSKRRHLVEEVLQFHNLSGYFKLIVGAQDVTHHKPHPESVTYTMTKLSGKPEETVVIGDSIYDLDMARNAGVDAIGVTTGIHTRELLERCQPRHVVDGLDEVLPIILNGKAPK